jgi:MFS family permease
MSPDAITTGPAAGERLDRSFARDFAGVFAACLLAFMSLGAVLPVLPRYVTGPLGAGDVAVGIVIGSFAVAGIAARFWAGRHVDTRGRRSALLLGAGGMAIAGLLYFLPQVVPATGVAGLVVARLVLGAGEAFMFTAGSTWVVDVAPESRRGQAIGLFGLSIWGGLSAGPLIGEGLLTALGFEAVWAFTAVAPLAAALVALRLAEPRVAPSRDGPRALLPAAALRPGLALSLAAVGYAALGAFIVLHLAERGMGGGAGVFTAFAVAVVGTRLLGGRLPDRLGPGLTAAAAGVSEALGLALIALAGSYPVALAGAVLTGAGFALLYPSLALLVVRRADERARGAALGAFTAFFDLGVGLGAPLAGVVASLVGYAGVFWMAAGAAVAAIAIARAAAAAAGDPPAPAAV